jgi:hypothetical protein
LDRVENVGSGEFTGYSSYAGEGGWDVDREDKVGKRSFFGQD